MFIYLYIFGYLKVAIILTIPPNTYITETFNIDLREAFLIIIKTFQKLKTNFGSRTFHCKTPEGASLCVLH